MPSKLIKLGWAACERGNTLLVQEDGPNMVAWLTVEGDVRLLVAWTPDNYPALQVEVCSLTDEELAAHIREQLLPNGWVISKLNLGVSLDPERATTIFNDAVNGLKEYWPVLRRKKVVAKIKKLVSVPYTGNDQADYKATRDAVEKLADDWK